MSLTSKLITSAVAGSLAGVVANFVINRNKRNRENSERKTENFGINKNISAKDDQHYFV